jgi:hypothetical protein
MLVCIVPIQRLAVDTAILASLVETVPSVGPVLHVMPVQAFCDQRVEESAL